MAALHGTSASNSDDTVKGALRTALEHSPDNVLLWQHSGGYTLLGLNRVDEAEQGVPSRPGPWRRTASRSSSAWLRCISSRARIRKLLVVIEDLLRISSPPARAYLLHARLLFRAGDVAESVRQYREAIDADPTAADAELAQAGLGARCASRGR